VTRVPLALVPPDAIGAYASLGLLERVNLAAAVFAEIRRAVTFAIPVLLVSKYRANGKKAKNREKN
jgi:hypothetical protein